MLKYRLIHPELVAALAQCGHGDYILLADSNYPVTTRTSPDARIIYLNLEPGVLSVTDILPVLLDAIPLESAAVMVMDNGEEAPVVADYRKLLPQGMEVQKLGRYEFYDAAVQKTAVAIATGEQRLYANLLLGMGVVTS